MAATPGPLRSKDIIYIVCKKQYLNTHVAEGKPTLSGGWKFASSRLVVLETGYFNTMPAIALCPTRPNEFPFAKSFFLRYESFILQ
jgi:hypothetical protein